MDEERRCSIEGRVCSSVDERPRIKHGTPTRRTTGGWVSSEGEAGAHYCQQRVLGRFREIQVELKLAELFHYRQLLDNLVDRYTRAYLPHRHPPSGLSSDRWKTGNCCLHRHVCSIAECHFDASAHAHWDHRTPRGRMSSQIARRSRA